MAKRRDSLSNAFLVCLSFWVFVAAMTYIGSSIRPETSFSDIRTITIVLMSILLPFSFASKKFISRVKSRRILLCCLIVLIAVASIRTVYEITPKSIEDPIYVVEDSRLGSTNIINVADFLNENYGTGGIVGDYKTLNRIGGLLPNSNYEKRFLNETTITEPFSRFPNKSILVFNIAGLSYPSIYHSNESYVAAYNFSLSHNQLYDNGIVVIASK